MSMTVLIPTSLSPEKEFYTGHPVYHISDYQPWDAACPPRPIPDRKRQELLDKIQFAKLKISYGGGNHIEIKSICAPAMAGVYRALQTGLENLTLGSAPLSQVCSLLAVSDNDLDVKNKSEFLLESVIARHLKKWNSAPQHSTGNSLKPLLALEIIAGFGLSTQDFLIFQEICRKPGIIGKVVRYFTAPENIINAHPPNTDLWTQMETDWRCLREQGLCGHRDPHIVVT